MIVKMDKMTDIPVGSNPDNYQPPGRTIGINNRFSAITFDHASNILVIVDRLTGKRRKLTFPTERRVATKTKNQGKREVVLTNGISIKA